MELKRIISELENENVRYLPVYVVYEYISEIEYALLEENTDRGEIYKILYLLSLNPYARSKVLEILNYLQ